MAINYLQTGIILGPTRSYSQTMIQHYLKSALRSLLRNKTYTFITMAGLATGIAVFLLLFQYVAFEWSANRFHTNYDRLYRLSTMNKEGRSGTFLPPGLGPVLKEKFPAIEDYVCIADDLGGGVLTIDNGQAMPAAPLSEENIGYADQGFFKVFSFPPAEGNPSLKDPATAAISEALAHTLFGNATATGKTITVTNQFGKLTYTITGVYKDMPAQSDIKARILLSFSTLANPANLNGNTWADPKSLAASFAHIYLLLRQGAGYGELEKQATGLMHFVNPDSKTDRLAFQPFSALHLAPSFDYHLQTFGSRGLVTLLLAVSILILFIAWINYINLCTAQGLKRALETGVRKVLGAGRRQLIAQYLTETIILTCLSVLLALVLVHLFQPLFNHFAGQSLSLAVLDQGIFWLAGILLIALGSLLSGSYAAFILSGSRPAIVIRNKSGASAGRSFSWRKGLVVFQFTISVVFIIATIALYRQLKYMQTENLGMNIQQRLIIKGPSGFDHDNRQHSIAFKNALSQLPFIQKFCASNAIPGQGYNYSTDGVTRLSPQKGDEKKDYSMIYVDNNYFNTYDIALAEGRTFTNEETVEGPKGHKVLINQTAAALLGFPANEPVAGKKIRIGDTGSEYEILGVVKDYHHLSLHKTIDPIIFEPSVSLLYFTILTDAPNMSAKIGALQRLYRTYFEGTPFEYYFADEYFAKQYSDDQRLNSLFIASACLAVLIACLGLFGLAAFSARQRVKEIGIRKVLGASLTDITSLVSKDFIRLVLIAVLIAIPASWWALHKWMEGFAYQKGLDWWIFPLAAILSLGVALLTVGSQAIKAALADPVDSLRSE